MTYSQIWNVFIITGFISINKFVKNKFWLIIAVSPTRYKGDGDGSSVYSPENEGGQNFLNGQMVECSFMN